MLLRYLHFSITFSSQKLHFSIKFSTAKIHFSIKTTKQIGKKVQKWDCPVWTVPLLFCFVFRAALVAVIGAVVVEFDFDVGLLQFTLVRQLELDVLDVQTACYPHRLVVRLDAQEASGER